MAIQRFILEQNLYFFVRVRCTYKGDYFFLKSCCMNKMSLTVGLTLICVAFLQEENILSSEAFFSKVL